MIGLVSLVAACGGERPTVEESAGPQPGDSTPSTVADVPSDAAAFLEQATGGEGTFTARYHVLRKLGSVETEVRVAQSPPWSKVEAGDVVVISGPDDYTCRVSAAKCVPELREQQLTPFGVFSAFFSTGPIQAVETMVRVDGATFERSSRTAAGLELDCLAVLVGGAQSGEWCVTGDGVFGYVDTADVRVELLELDPAAKPSFDPPGEVVDDAGFLLAAADDAAEPAPEGEPRPAPEPEGEPEKETDAEDDVSPPFTAAESADNRCGYSRCAGGG